MATTPESKERMRLRKKILAKVEESKELEQHLATVTAEANAVAAQTICGRCNKNKLECKCGRPLLLETNPGKLVLLREAFKLGCSDEHACVFAEISVDALQNYIKSHPEFAVEKEKLKLLPLMKARSNVVNAIALGNIPQSNWYLERKSKDEFGNKQEIEHKVSPIAEIIQKVEDEQ